MKTFSIFLKETYARTISELRFSNRFDEVKVRNDYTEYCSQNSLTPQWREPITLADLEKLEALEAENNELGNAFTNWNITEVLGVEHYLDHRQGGVNDTSVDYLNIWADSESLIVISYSYSSYDCDHSDPLVRMRHFGSAKDYNSHLIELKNEVESSDYPSVNKQGRFSELLVKAVPITLRIDRKK